MQYQKISMPLASLLPMGLGVLAFYSFLAIFNLLRFAHCPSWTFFQFPPVAGFQIAGAVGYQVYLRSSDGFTYCNHGEQWDRCSLPAYQLSQKEAPEWFVTNFFSVPENTTVKQLVRVGRYSQVTYYALLEDGQVWACPVDLGTEVNNILSSVSVFLLILPLGIGVFSLIWFFRILVGQGEPMLWDFFGRGEKIK